MPTDVKDCILNHHAHFTTASDDIAQAHLATNNINSITLAPTILSQDELMCFARNDPLILDLALSMNHQAHTAIDGAHCIFRPDEDVPIEF